ncbi:MAG: hypothetical protein ABIE43_02815 [Patescibacteria group bacterium]
MFLYRDILKNSLKITWDNKYLWFFGFFAALLGSGGEYEIIGRGLNGETSSSLFPGMRRIVETGIFSSNTFTNIGKLFQNDPVSTIILLVIGLIILVLIGFLMWLTIVSQVALVNNSAGIITNKKKEFKDGVISGMKYFWRVLGLNIVIRIIILSAFTLIGLPLVFMASKTGWQTVNVIYIILFIIFIPIAVSLSFIMKYAICYVVIKGNSFIDSIKNSWQLFIGNWLISIEMAFTLFFINFIAGLGIILAILIITIPFLFLAFLLYKFIALAGFWIMAGIGIILLLFIVMAGGAALSVFQTVSWTNLYIKLSSKGGISKIIRMVDKWNK